MNGIPTIYPNPNMQLTERFAYLVSEKAKARFSWLKFAPGKAQHIIIDNKIIEPVVYKTESEWVSLLPDDIYKAYMFFDFEKTQEVEQLPGQYVVKGAGEVIVWLNIYNYATTKEFFNSEALKKELLDFFTTTTNYPVGCSATIKSITDNPKEVFAKYAIDSSKTQFLMHPYIGIKIMFNYKIFEICVI